MFETHPIQKVHLTDPQIFLSGGRPLYFVGGYDFFPRETWHRLDLHASPEKAREQISLILVDVGRKLAGLPPIKGTT